jgi:GT2 family glycosyltransferase
VTPAVAIAVVSWNTRELLRACLESMRPDHDAGRAEVWVVDNGSTDGSVELVREAFPWVQLHVPERNLGYGPAVNRVAERSDAAWVAASNADLELEPGALAALLAAAEARPRTGIAGPRLILPDGSTQPGVQPFPTVSDALLRNLSLYKLSRGLGERLCLDGYWDPDRAATVDWVTGAFFIVRRAAWDAIGGFDEDQWMYAEDIDICWRARRAGWEIRYEPSAVVHHHLSVAAEQAFGDTERRAARIMRANYDWLARRRGRPAAWAVAAASVGTLGLRTGALDVLARARPGRFGPPRDASRRLLRRQQAGVRALRGDGAAQA